LFSSGVSFNNATFSHTTGLMKIGRGATDSANDDWNPIDIVGHEFAHGVVKRSAGLVSQGESGALNESFADIFGVAVEKYGIGELDWTIGEDNVIYGTLRNLRNPK